MINTFPFSLHNQTLVFEDFIRFSDSFKKIVLAQLATAEDVVFVCNIATNEHGLSQEIITAIESGGRAGHLFLNVQGVLVFLFFTENEIVAAVISGVDELILNKATHDWLEEVRTTILNQFFMLKQARVDSETGLLNLSNLHHILQRFNVVDGGGLVLLELPPVRSGSLNTYRHLQKIIHLLNPFAGVLGSLHYLGQCVFGLVTGSTVEPLAQAVRIVAYLKREGVKRVHAGVSSSLLPASLDAPSDKGQQVLDQAWTALQEAKTRGPYSFCDYCSLVNIGEHPLVAPPVAMRRKLSLLTRSLHQFCLVLFKEDSGTSPEFLAFFKERYSDKVVFSWGRDICVLLPNQSGQAGYEIAVDAVNDLNKQNIVASGGVSFFPYKRFPKSEMAGQCRKALLHTAFYGKGTVTLFNAVSFNISGDIYYSEGDFTKACREYDAGLHCDGHDINLLNSLGVTYAMMNKREALSCFDRVLDIEPNNFMALYNRGLHLQSSGDEESAVNSLEQALACHGVVGKKAENLTELQLQLGVLCSKINRPERALELLLPFVERKDLFQNQDILFYVGKSYNDLGQRKEAIVWLQRAATVHCVDDQTLSLLGYLYFLEGEGDDVALSLCRKSVELNPEDHQLTLRLAVVLLGVGHIEQSLILVRKCMRVKKVRATAREILVKIYTQLGEEQRVKRLSARPVGK